MGIRERAGYELAKIGERIGSDRLTYNPVIFEMYDRLAGSDAPAVVEALRETFPDVRRAMDVGAGSGAYAAEAQRRGWEITAIERSSVGQRHVKAKGVEVFDFDLGKEPPSVAVGAVDLAYCFEVAEHVPANLADALVSFLVGRGARIVLTAAPPGQGGTGHVNEQPASYWIDLFAAHGRQPHQDLRQQFVSRLPLDTLSEHWRMTNVLVF
jgi:SAM-dependent methyltransferase